MEILYPELITVLECCRHALEKGCLPRSTHVSGGVHDELPLDGAHAVLLVLRVQLVAGDHEGVHVGDGAAGGEDAVPSLQGCYSVVS